MALLSPGFQRFAFSQVGHFGDVTGITEINTKWQFQMHKPNFAPQRIKAIEPTS